MTTCPFSDETCSSCPRCVGGEFIPTAGLPPCTCDGTGCDNAEHRTCEHGAPTDEPCEPCWLEAQDVATGIADEEAHTINPEVSR